MRNQLFCGDNLDVLRRYFADDSVDLIYLDPPFKSDQDYNLLFREKNGALSQSQILAFEDTWEWNQEAQKSFLAVVGAGGKLGEVMSLFRAMLGESDMLAYLAMMAPRLIELHRVLKPTGSIYLHCDPTASHYLRALLDAIFGPRSFRNEIIWKRTTAHSAAKRWNDVHDTLLFYAKGPNYTWNAVVMEHTQEYRERYKNADPDGRLWADDNLTGPGIRHGESGTAWRGFNPTAKGVHWKVSLKAVESIVGKESRRNKHDREARFIGCTRLNPLAKAPFREGPGIPAFQALSEHGCFDSGCHHRYSAH